MVPLDRPRKGHQLLKVFDFLTLILNFWIEFKVSFLAHTNSIYSPRSSADGLYKILYSYLLVRFFDEKIRQNASQPVIRARLGVTKPPSKHKTHSSRIFWGPLWRRRWRFVHTRQLSSNFLCNNYLNFWSSTWSSSRKFRSTCQRSRMIGGNFVRSGSD